MGLLVTKKGVIKKINKYTPIPDGEYSTPIKIDPESIKQNALHFGVDDLGVLLTGKNLADISTIANVNGVPTGAPANNGVNILMYDFQKTDWYNVGSYKIIFDLGRDYNLDYCYLWRATGSIELWGSEDGAVYKQLAPNFETLFVDGWTKVSFVGDARANNRYFILGLKYQDMYLKGCVLYGRPTGADINQGIKFRRRILTHNTDMQIGTNGFYLEHAEMMANVSGLHRLYVVPQWIFGPNWWNPGQGKGKTPSDVEMRFTKADPEGVVNIDQVLQGYKNAGSKVMIDINNSPSFLRPIGTKDPGASKPVDPGFSTVNLKDTTDPMKYTFISRIAWNIAARYGYNVNIDTQFVKLVPGEPIRVGLGLMDCLEMGNEMDKWWYGAQAYTNPQEMAAYMSAIYDGHMNQMGPGFGIKNADPSMKVSLVSTASGDNVDYINEIIWWCDKYRGKGNYPFDVLNYHWYNSSEGSQDAADGAYGVQPEIGSLIAANKKWSDFRDKYCPGVEVWLTEIGYDEHLGGVFSPKYGTQFERSRYKAYWLTRTYMINQMCGVDATMQYWYSNHGGIRLQDNDPYEPRPDKFRSSGLTDGIRDANDWNRKPLMSYWYVANIKNALTGYRYTHTIMMRGVSNTNENIINTVQGNIWAMAYFNPVLNTRIIVAWLDSAEFKTVQISLNVPETLVEVTNIDEAEIRQSLVGVNTFAHANNGSVNLVISECPIFIKTSGVGTPLLMQPENIQTQKITKGGVLVTWLDRNVIDVDILVRRSENEFSGYATIYQGKSSDAEYADATALSSKNYFYKIQIIPAGSDPIEPPVEGNEIWRQAFDHAYLAGKALNDNGVQVVSGQPVKSFVDQIGSINMPYTGIATPMLSGTKPVFYDQLGGYVFFQNETGVNYKTPAVQRAWPRERWTMGRISNYLVYEAFHNAFGTEYLGDLSFSGLRTRNGSDDGSHMTDKHLIANTSFLIREVYTDDNEFTDAQGNRPYVNVRLELNGVYVGKVMSTWRSNPNSFGVGADTNNSHWGMMGLFYKQGVMNSATAAQVTQELMNLYNIGQQVNLPYADNLSFDKVGTIVTATYTYKSYNGVPEDESARKVRWIYIEAGVTVARYMPELNNLMVWDSANFAAKYPLAGKGLRVEITCVDMLGNKFIIPQSQIKDL